MAVFNYIQFYKGSLNHHIIITITHQIIMSHVSFVSSQRKKWNDRNNGLGNVTKRRLLQSKCFLHICLV